MNETFLTFLVLIIFSPIVVVGFFVIKFMKKNLITILQMIFQNWREIMGWVFILIFFIIYGAHFFHGNNYYTEQDFEFFVVIMIFILGWLKLNKK